MFIDHLFSKDPADQQLYVTVVGVSLVSIVLHELGHALAATWEGDPTPKIRGHLTWNPVVHMGWLSIGLLVVAGLAWGRTPVTPSCFRHRRWGEVIVSFAGPAVNLLLAVFAAFALTAARMAGAPSIVAYCWGVMVWWNVVLFLFNMIPIPPFDGFGVLDGAVDLGDLGRQARGTGSMFGWFIAAALVNFGVIPIFDWGDTMSRALVRAAETVFGVA